MFSNYNLDAMLRVFMPTNSYTCIKVKDLQLYLTGKVDSYVVAIPSSFAGLAWDLGGFWEDSQSAL